MPFRLIEIVVEDVGAILLPAVLPTAMANEAVAAWDSLKGNERLTVLLSAYRGVVIEQSTKDAVIEKVGLRTWESLVRIFAVDGNNLYWNLLSNDRLFDEYGYRVFSFVEESGDFLARPIPTVLDPIPEEVFSLHVHNVFAGDADRIDLVPREVVYLHAPKNVPSDTEGVTLHLYQMGANPSCDFPLKLREASLRKDATRWVIAWNTATKKERTECLGAFKR